MNSSDLFNAMRQGSSAAQQQSAYQSMLNQQQDLLNRTLNAQMGLAQQRCYSALDEQYRALQQWVRQEENRMKPQPLTREMFPHKVANREIPGVGWVEVIKIPSSIHSGERFEIRFIPWVDPKKTGGKMSFQQYKWYQRRPKPFLVPHNSRWKSLLYGVVWLVLGCAGAGTLGWGILQAVDAWGLRTN